MTWIVPSGRRHASDPRQEKKQKNAALGALDPVVGWAMPVGWDAIRPAAVSCHQRFDVALAAGR